MQTSWYNEETGTPDLPCGHTHTPTYTVYQLWPNPSSLLDDLITSCYSVELVDSMIKTFYLKRVYLLPYYYLHISSLYEKNIKFSCFYLAFIA